MDVAKLDHGSADLLRRLLAPEACVDVLAALVKQTEAKLREQKFPPVVFECTKLDTGRRRSIG